MKQFRWVFLALIIAECLIPLFAMHENEAERRREFAQDVLRDNGEVLVLVCTALPIKKLPTEIVNEIIGHAEELFIPSVRAGSFPGGHTAAGEIARKSTFKLNFDILDRSFPRRYENLNDVIVENHKKYGNVITIGSFGALKLLMDIREIRNKLNSVIVEFRNLQNGLEMLPSTQNEVRNFMKSVNEQLIDQKIICVKTPRLSNIIYPNVQNLELAGTLEHMNVHQIYPNVKSLIFAAVIVDEGQQNCLNGYNSLKKLDLFMIDTGLHFDTVNSILEKNKQTLQELYLELVQPSTITALEQCTHLKKLSMGVVTMEIMKTNNLAVNLPSVDSLTFCIDQLKNPPIIPQFRCGNLKRLSLTNKYHQYSKYSQKKIITTISTVTQYYFQQHDKLVEIDLQRLATSVDFLTEVPVSLIGNVDIVTIDASLFEEDIINALPRMIDACKSKTIKKGTEIIVYNIAANTDNLTNQLGDPDYNIIFQHWEMDIEVLDIGLKKDLENSENVVTFKHK